MRERTDEVLPLEAMAEIAHLSPYHFARTFRRVTGVPPGEFLGALRLERAKELLLTTDLSVSEVCFEVGYNSLGTFTSRFTRLVGLPPGRLRRLPEEADRAFERLRDHGPPGSAAPATDPHGVAGRIVASGVGEVLIFVGLFPGPIPQGRPVAGTLLTAPGPFRLVGVPDGRYQLMAAALPFPAVPAELLLPGSALRVGRAPDPLLVRRGQKGGCADVVLRPPRATDPPILVALPALLLERLAPGLL
jgi:AraC family transcriptional regulator